jgi:Mrp family chromosome partitioning ATPase
MKFNNKQLIAIDNLEKALKQLYDSGLRVQGMDSNLNLFKCKDYEQIYQKHNDFYKAFSEMQQKEMIKLIEDHGAYLGSGGW